MAWLWLLGAGAAGAAAYFVGWPAWTQYRSREERDLNTERYLAWRGRADRTGSGSLREGLTGEERRRLVVAGLLGLVALASLVAFFGAA